MDVESDELQEAYRASMTRLFDETAPRPGWLITFALGAPGDVLVQQAEHARLLAIGTGEHVGVQRLLVGSVSHYCLSHARCPVAAIPFDGLDVVGRPSSSFGAEDIS